MDLLTQQLLHLNLISGIGPAFVEHLLQATQGAATVDFYSWKVSDFISVGISPNKAKLVVEGLADTKTLHKELRALDTQNVEVIAITDPAYPELLKEIYLPPFILYCRGNKNLLKTNSLAVVGSRAADNYGKRVVSMLLPSLIEYGLTIVSGGATGIDTFAHAQTLECKGNTVVVLGSGLLQLYPPSNRKLFDTIVENNGLIITPFSLHTQPAPGNFPARNRIIAGISQGCLVVQAGEKSGARITAMFALEQGRDVFAVPGAVDNQLSYGCHALISQGATLVQSSDDILRQLDPSWQKSVAVNSPGAQEDLQSSFQPAVLAEHSGDDQSTENKVLRLCKTPVAFDALLASLGLSAEELQHLLFMHQIEGRIEQTMAGLWKSL